MTSEFWTREVLQGSLSSSARRFFAWYRREFFNFFSPETIAWLTDRGDRLFILKAGERELWCVNGRGDRNWRLTAEEISSSSLEESLNRRNLTRNAVRIGLEIDAPNFFVRQFEIPSVALANLPKLLVSDIERKTPFRLADVIYGHTYSRNTAAPDKFRIALWILRRNLAVDAVERAGLEFSDISFIRPAGDLGPGQEKPIIELESKRQSSHRVRNIALGLSAAIVIFSITGGVATIWRQSSIKVELDSKIHVMTEHATRVRQLVDKTSAESRLLSVLRTARHNLPLFADLWEETARILPDSAFITDMRFSETKPGERVLDLVGFASSAVGLPALFNKSPIFADATLTAPITPDQHEKREGFSLQAKIEHQSTGKAQ